MICPGLMQTPMLAQFYSRPGRTDPEGALRAMVASIPLQRIGKPEEVGWTAVFLASDEASFITGVALPVDGGYTAK